MSTITYVLWRNVKTILDNTFWLKKVPYLELCLFQVTFIKYFFTFIHHKSKMTQIDNLESYLCKLSIKIVRKMKNMFLEI